MNKPNLRYTAKGVEGEIELDFVDEVRMLMRISELCKLRARPKIINAIVGGRTSRTLADFGRLYREITGESPPKGQLPNSPDSIMNTAERKLHGSFIIRKYIKLERAGVEYEEALYKSYLSYLDQFKAVPADAPVPFDYAFRLISFYKNGAFYEVKCTDCTLTYLKTADVPVSRFSCPICATLRGRSPATRKRAVEDASSEVVSLPGIAQKDR